MTPRTYILLSALVGTLTGFLSIHSFLAHSWTSIIFWVIVGAALLYFSPNRKSALYAGAVFGFSDIAVWLITGFQGGPSQIKGFLILTFGLSIFGALCGLLGAMIFWRLFRRN